jgi:hypothetical protein
MLERRGRFTKVGVLCHWLVVIFIHHQPQHGICLQALAVICSDNAVDIVCLINPYAWLEESFL